MTREDIIRMAREAGLFVHKEVQPEIERFAALIASWAAAAAKAEEREACAKVCDELREWQTPKSCAVYIRARGQA